MTIWNHGLPFGLLLILCLPPALQAADSEPLPVRAEEALRRACSFFHDQVSCRGGYLWTYSADLEKREGEGRADRWTVWVQPPGTPAVGEALLEVHRRTGDEYYLDLARETGRCLLAGQLRSGGWDYRIDFEPARRQRYAYRVEPPRAGARNTSTLDDDTTQSALRFLMRLDQTLQFRDEAIHEAARFGLGSLLDVQYPNGAWPQRFDGPPDPAAFPVLAASYPESWSREFPAPKYAEFYTLNDNTLIDTIDLMLLAAEVYQDPQYRRAALKGADFLLLAQMPEPQPGWAQQYDRQMHPAWARRFEPPAITGSESAGVVRCLLRIYAETGEKKYLEAAGRGLAYYRRLALPGGGLARFYELHTDRPLYFTKQYELTYDGSDVPTHYSFRSGDWTPALTRQYESLAAMSAEQLRSRTKRTPETPRLSETLSRRAAELVEGLDERGAWVESGRLRYHGDEDDTTRIIRSQTFSANIRQLAAYLAAARAADAAP